MTIFKTSTSNFRTCLTLLLVTLAFSFSAAYAEIEITENLSISGFLDMSSVLVDDGTDKALGASFDQFELDFHFDYGSVTGRVDIDTTGVAGESSQNAKLEQGFVTYTLPEDLVPGTSITAGRFLSSFGFEAAEPTGLYQFSVSEGIPYPGYQNGVAINVSPMEKIGVYVAVLSGVWDVEDTDLENPGFEAQLSLMPIEQLTAKIGFAIDDTGADDKRSEVNAWASFAQGPLTIAGEIDLLSNWPSDKTGEIRDSGIHFLGMANVSLQDIISAPVGVTVRFSGINLDEEETSKEITFSPSFAATDNWLLLAEFKRLIDEKSTEIAVESLFSF